MPDKTEGSLLLPIKIENSSNNQGTTPGTAISLNLHSLILENPSTLPLVMRVDIPLG